MRNYSKTVVMLASITPLLFAESNALIEVKLFKPWVVKEENMFGTLAIKNTGTDPIFLAKDAFDFDVGQLVTRSLPRNTPYEESKQEKEYLMMMRDGDGLFGLPAGETYLYEGYKFYFVYPDPSATEMRFTISIYLGKDLWLDSEPLTVNRVIPDSEEYLATINNKKVNTSDMYKMVAVTYKNERWLYKKSTRANNLYFPICPLSLTNKIRVEPHDNENLFKIWDGDNPMIYHLTKSILTEGPDENNVLGKWTRERKQRAEADNAEVRRKKAEGEK